MAIYYYVVRGKWPLKSGAGHLLVTAIICIVDDRWFKQQIKVAAAFLSNFRMLRSGPSHHQKCCTRRYEFAHANDELVPTTRPFSFCFY